MAPRVPRRDISSAAARARRTGASKLAVKEAWSAAPPVQALALHPGGVSGERHDPVEVALQGEGRLEVAPAHLRQGDVSLHELHEPAVVVLELLLEGEGVALVAAVAHDGYGPLLEEESGDGPAQPAGAPGHEDHAPGERLAIEVVAVLRVAAGLVGVEVARRHGHSSKRRRRPTASRPTSESTTRCAARSLSPG
jgi:hypothetical protein